MSKFVTFADIVLAVSGFSHSAFFPSGQLIHRLEISGDKNNLRTT